MTGVNYNRHKIMEGVGDHHDDDVMMMMTMMNKKRRISQTTHPHMWVHENIVLKGKGSFGSVV